MWYCSSKVKALGHRTRLRPWAAGLLLAACGTGMWSTGSAQDAPVFQLAGRHAAHQPMWSTGGPRLDLSLKPTISASLQYRQANTGITGGSFTTSQAHLAYQPGRKPWRFSLRIADDREADVLQRLNIMAGGAYRVRLASDLHFVAGFVLGYGQRTWRNRGVWDDQYVNNPIDPAAGLTNEVTINGARSHHFDAGISCRIDSKHSTTAYRLLHAPADQGFLRNGSDRMDLRHSLIYVYSGKLELSAFTLPFRAWAEIERQSGAMRGSVGGWVEWTFGQDSRLTGFQSASIIVVGCSADASGLLSPILGTTIDRQWTIWASPDIRFWGEHPGTGAWSIGLRGLLPLS
jgi:hypothetical protein